MTLKLGKKAARTKAKKSPDFFCKKRGKNKTSREFQTGFCMLPSSLHSSCYLSLGSYVLILSGTLLMFCFSIVYKTGLFGFRSGPFLGAHYGSDDLAILNRSKQAYIGRHVMKVPSFPTFLPFTYRALSLHFLPLSLPSLNSAEVQVGD